MKFYGRNPFYFRNTVETQFFTGVITGLDRYIPSGQPWTKPAEWLSLPSISPNDQQFYGLFSVDSGEFNYATVRANGRYAVNWGDGTSGEYASASRNTKIYDYNQLTGTPLSDGTKQVIVSIYPISGDNLTLLAMQDRDSVMGSKVYNEQWLDVEFSFPFLTNLTFGSTSKVFSSLKNVDIINVSTGLSSLANLFYNCHSLEKFTFPASGLSNNITTMLSAFFNCYSLRYVPSFNVSGVVSAQSLFDGCRSLTEVEPLKFYNLNNASSMFANCNNLRKIPSGYLISGSGNINISSCFNTCSSLENIPNDIFSSQPIYSNVSSLFRACPCLLEYPNQLNFSGVSSLSDSVFNGCGSISKFPSGVDLRTVRNLANFFNSAFGMTGYNNIILNNTGVFDANNLYSSNTSLRDITSGMLDFPNAGNVSNIVSACFSLEYIPWFNAPLATTGTNMFGNCSDLKSINYLNLASMPSYTNIFANCNSLKSINSGIFNPAATYTNTFTNLPSLSWVNISGIGESISFAGCALHTGGLVNIFNNLRTVVGKTITISNNPGLSGVGLTAGQIAIATSKGWSVTT
jgi:hypothetical protein